MYFTLFLARCSDRWPSWHKSVYFCRLSTILKQVLEHAILGAILVFGIVDGGTSNFLVIVPYHSPLGGSPRYDTPKL